MILESGKLLHIGINYLVAPISEINEEKEYEFQGYLKDARLGITDKRFEGDSILALRRKPTTLEIKIGSAGPQVVQLLIVAPHPFRALETFVQEANEVVTAFVRTWMQQNFQVLHSDATIRYLYDSSREHAFSELWEDRLGQRKEALAVFGRPVLGGGLRFVMPQRDAEDDPKKVELKIESYLKESKQVFVEVQFNWDNPIVVTNAIEFRVEDRINNLEDFIENRVHAFMTGESNDASAN